MLLKALVKNRDTKKLEIVEMDYPTKKAFTQDLRKNGYLVNPIKVKKSEVFDHIMNNTNCYEWDWKENN